MFGNRYDNPDRRPANALREMLVEHGMAIAALGIIATDAIIAGNKFHIVPQVVHYVSHMHQDFIHGLQNMGRPG